MGIEALSKLQDMLYAQDSWAVLLIFQAMDAAGKDSTIKHVMSGVNPQGCEVTSFKGAVLRGPRPRLPLALREAPAHRGHIASSTAATTRRPSWCACTLSSWRSKRSRPMLVTTDIWKERHKDIRAFGGT